MPYSHASMLLLGEGSEATVPYNKYDKIRPHSIRSLQFDQKVRPLSFRPERFDLFTATPELNGYSTKWFSLRKSIFFLVSSIQSAISKSLHAEIKFLSVFVSIKSTSHSDIKCLIFWNWFCLITWGQTE